MKKKIIKVFISQPMNGKDDKEILREREAIINIIKNDFLCMKDVEKVEIIDSFVQNAPLVDSPMWYLGESIKKLAEADAMYLAKDWKDARGCRIEFQVATEYDIPIIKDCECLY